MHQDTSTPGGGTCRIPGIGDLVVRKSHNADVVFKIVSLNDGTALLRGICLRVMADAPLSDLSK